MNPINDGIVIALLMIVTLAGIIGLALGTIITPVLLWRRCHGYHFLCTERCLVACWSFFFTGIWFIVNKTNPTSANDGLLSSNSFATISLVLLSLGSIGLLPAWLLYRRESRTAKPRPRLG